MAILTNSDVVNVYRTVTGMTAGNETIFASLPEGTYNVDCVVTSAGSATLKTSNDIVTPQPDFSAMCEVLDGTKTVSFSRNVHGVTSIGLSVSSGTWTIKVRKVD